MREPLIAGRSNFYGSCVFFLSPGQSLIRCSGDRQRSTRLFAKYHIMILCSKATAVAEAVRAANAVAQDPDKLNFLIFLVLAAIGCAVLSLFITLIVKAVFELDKEESGQAFGVSFAILMVLNIIVYFII